MISAFFNEAWSHSTTNVALTIDYEDNELVNKFFVKHGFARNGI